MLGAIIGDYVGSRFEWNNIKIKEFEFFHNNCQLTDDSIMTIAITDALLNARFDDEKLKTEAIKAMQSWGKNIPIEAMVPILKNGFKHLIRNLIIVMGMVPQCV